MSDAVRWRRLRDLFDELVELAPEQIAPRLAELRTAHPDLADEVTELLAADHENGLSRGASLIVESATPAERSRRYGNWIPAELLGEGGMGRVYLARRADRAFEKTAALKVLRAGIDGLTFRERFASERRIVAALEHPGIARLLDGGETEDGVPFLVLEHVAGIDLVQWCESERLALAARLRLFRHVLDAVAFAHRRLVVHRDLKPGNILVGDDGAPKLLDFGIAKILEPEVADGERTVTAERMLTPEYASPEQIRGAPVSIGSDIYSLGVVLFELLVGRTPFRDRATSPGALARAIEEEAAPAPSAVLAQLPPADHPIRPAELRGDCDAIVLKALRKEPEARYRSVEAFADDLDAYLSGRPVAARRGTLAYRAAKFTGRHRWKVAAAIATGAAFALTVAGYTLRLRTERDFAEQRFAETRALARFLLFDLHDAIRDLEGATAARRTLLEHALDYLERLRVASHGDRSLAREVAEGHLRVAEILSDRRAAAGLELSEEAEPLLDRARQLVDVAEPSLGDRRLLVRILGAMARRRFSGEIETEQRLRAARRAVGFAEEIASSPDATLEDRRALARTLRDLVDLLGFSGRIAEAEEPARRAFQISDATLRGFGTDRDARLDLADSALAFGRVMYRLGHAAEALDAFAEARGELETLQSAAPESVEVRDRLANLLATIGSHTWQNGRAADGVALLERAVSLHAGLVASDPDNEQAKRRLASARTELAIALVAAGRLEEALQEHGDALDSLHRARERRGAPAFLIYEEAFLHFHLATAARIAAAGAETPADREAWLERARGWYTEALRLRREGEEAGTPSHLEPETWDRVAREAAELGVS